MIANNSRPRTKLGKTLEMGWVQAGEGAGFEGSTSVAVHYLSRTALANTARLHYWTRGNWSLDHSWVPNRVPTAFQLGQSCPSVFPCKRGGTPSFIFPIHNCCLAVYRCLPLNTVVRQRRAPPEFQENHGEITLAKS